MAKKKLKWTDVEDLAFQLIDMHPSTDPMRLSLGEVAKKVTALPNFGGGPKPDSDVLEAIQQSWYEERSDMEDELGPLSADDSDDDLNEDEYRDDRMIDDEVSVVSDDDDEDEDELGDGFHEDEMDEGR